MKEKISHLKRTKYRQIYNGKMADFDTNSIKRFINFSFAMNFPLVIKI